MTTSRITRREMLKLSALGGIGLAIGLGGCATVPKDVNWAEVPDEEFSIHKFDSWFKMYKLYNGVNPNLKLGGAGNYGTFKTNTFSPIGATPGVDYSSDKLYAAADGVVTMVGDLFYERTGRATGLYVQVTHSDKIEEKYKSTNFTHVGDPARFGDRLTTHYAHLGDLNVDVGQRVNRGDLIGSVPSHYHRIAKLMLTNRSNNYVDPDNYGHNHSYMDYWDGKDYSIQDVSERHSRQKDIWRKLCEHIKPETGIREGVLTQKQHRPIYQSKTCYWDNFTIFKYLVELYQARPTLFSLMPKDKFEELKREFYANQPIILTLPLKP